jgi:hypothetical protein
MVTWQGQPYFFKEKVTHSDIAHRGTTEWGWQWRVESQRFAATPRHGHRKQSAMQHRLFNFGEVWLSRSECDSHLV